MKDTTYTTDGCLRTKLEKKRDGFTFQQHHHTEYISLNWYDIPKLVVPIMIPVIEGLLLSRNLLNKWFVVAKFKSTLLIVVSKPSNIGPDPVQYNIKPGNRRLQLINKKGFNLTDWLLCHTCFQMKDKLASMRTEHLMANGKNYWQWYYIEQNIKQINLLFFEFVSM